MAEDTVQPVALSGRGVSLWRWMASLLLLSTVLGVTAYRGGVLYEQSRRLVIVIPSGTAAQIEAGQSENAPPHRIDLTLGVQDVLIIQNEDSEWHQVGPYQIAPGHTLVQRFSRPGTIRASCTMYPSHEVEIVVHER
jgi:hypothetical protein